ncbi:DUF222 domain-containing protein [Nocardioides sp. MAHUQ-72]|uniref:DUF222 domain-containing protein n=1 Tax=unclassified Nocardioides TaxID=2615069 RepID=UPI003622E723
MAVNPTPMTHPLVRGAGELAALVTDLAGFDPGYLDPAEKETALATLGRVVDQLAALYGRVLANADDVVTDTGDRNVAAWAERTQHADYPTVARQTRLGEALDRRWPRLQAACLDGRVNQAQAHVIVKAPDGLPDRLGPELTAQAEAHLVDQAAHFSPRELRRLGEHLLAVLAPEIADAEEQRRLEAEERAARRTTRLTMRVRGDGSTDIQIRVPDHVASRLRVYLEALAAPRRQEHRTGDSEVERLPYPRRLGEAFCALLERLPARVLPQHGGTATTVMVTIDLAQLTSGLGAAGLATGDRIIAAAEARFSHPHNARRRNSNVSAEVSGSGRAGAAERKSEAWRRWRPLPPATPSATRRAKRAAARPGEAGDPPTEAVEPSQAARPPPVSSTTTAPTTHASAPTGSPTATSGSPDAGRPTADHRLRRGKGPQRRPALPARPATRFAGRGILAAPNAGRTTMVDESGPEATPPEPNPYAKLPPAIPLERMVATHETGEAPDPEGGRDTDKDFLLRYFA